MRLRRAVLILAGAVAALSVSSAPAFAQTGESGVATRIWMLVGALAAAGAVVALGVVLFGVGATVEADFRRRLRAYGRGSQEDEASGWIARIPILRRFVSSAEDVARSRGVFTVIESSLEQADIPLRPGEAIAAALALSLVAGTIAGVVTQSLVTAVLALVGMLIIAAIAVRVIATRERRRFEGQLPDTLNLISTSLRAGYSMLQALEAVASEASDPTAREFNRVLSEVRLGRGPTEALTDVADRMGSIDFEWAVLAISIQREVGGNLAEVLQSTSETMLQRNRLRREIKALTAEGRLSAIVLGALPFFLFAFLWLRNRSYIEPLFDSIWGVGAVVGALVLIGVGIAWLNRIVKVDI